jgi:hypothetical protein
MRGKSVDQSELKGLLKEIASKSAKLLSHDTDKDEQLKLMDEWGFKGRMSDSFLEENAQAFFIHGMVMRQEMYEGINFVASELVLPGESSRFDIVGYREGTLYIFEMKKGRSLEALCQAACYASLINQNKTLYLDVLRNYPHYAVDDFDKVIAIAVMRYAANSTTNWESKAKEAGVGVWFYERSIALHKVV